MAFIRPSLVLQAMLVPEEYNEDTAREIKRSFMYISQTIVKALSPEDAAEGNVMQFRIRMMKPYWDISDPSAVELWDSVMPRWLKNQAANMSTAMHNYNTVRHPGAAQNVSYEWAEFEFDKHVLLRVKMDDENRIAADIADIAGKVRRLMNEKVFGGSEIARIRIPSLASIEEQKAAFEVLKAQEQLVVEEGKQEGGEDVEQVCEQAELPCEEVEVQDTTSVVVDFGAKPVAGQGSIAREETPAPVVRPSFSLAYHVWGIEYADGHTEEFDSRLN